MKKTSRFLIPLFALIALTPWFSSGLALLSGILLAFLFGNPYSDYTKKGTHHFLSLAVIGLGAGMNLKTVLKVGASGIGYTVAGILFAFLISKILNHYLKIERKTSTLITVGTAICGGSAIAAVAPVIKAKSEEVSVALGIVFTLNALALFLFPFVGHQLHLTETQFGLWSALAIHDTSSVVGSTLHYGPQALQVGTTVKLARALWIIPVALSLSFFMKEENSTEKGKAKKPWFILGFILMATLMTYVPELQTAGHYIELVAKKLMILTLFLIGTNLTKDNIKNVGFRPFVLGVGLWLIIASTMLFFICKSSL